MSTPEVGAEEVTLPTKRTEGETLAERLTDNAYHNILPARYLKKDGDGQPVEEPEDLFERVAKNIALAEAVYGTDESVTVTPEQVKPDHPRRGELAGEAFGVHSDRFSAPETLPDDLDEARDHLATTETQLTEGNVSKFAYDSVVPGLDDELREHVEGVYREFREAMEGLQFMPNSPTLMNAGDELQQLSACFVCSPEDDITDIHETAREAAEVFQCLTDDSTVTVEDKGIVGVSEVEAGDRILQQSSRGFQYRRVEETHEYEDAETLTVELSNGLSIQGTPNHRIEVDGEWTRFDRIDAGQDVHYALGWLRETERERPALESVESGARWSESRGVDNEAIAELHREGFSDYEIAERLDCGKSTVQRRRSEELQLPPNGSGGRNPGASSFDETNAERLHEAGHTDSKIAESLGVESASIQRFRARQDLEPNGTPVKTVSQPARLSDELAELVGLWVGDGSWHTDGVRFHVGRESVAEYIDQLSRKLFDTDVSTTFAEGCFEVTINSHEIRRWWEANFDCKDDAQSARVPDVVKRAPADAVESFLRGYFTADGTLLNDTYPKLYSSSETAINDVATLMMGLGYPVKKSVIRDEEAHPYYGLIPTTGRGRESFLRDVGFIDERRETALESIESVSARDSYDGGTEYTVEVESVTESADATVYDITVADNHEYITDGIVSHNSGGGMGYAFWRLRPYGDPVGSTGGIASGPLTFMRTYDQLCETIAQGGARRGAQMAVMRVSHPDIVQFVHAKNKDVSLARTLRLNDPDDYTHTSFIDALEEARDLIDDDGRIPEHLRNAVEGHLSNFNISVGVTDDFMEAVREGEEYTFTNPRTGEPHVATQHTKELYDRFGLGENIEVGEPVSLPAELLWERIVDGAHENGEPGVVFLDRINEEHSFPVESTPSGESSEYEILATNPCLHGDMDVAVADGRESVPIAELAAEDGPTPVYTLREDGQLTIREAEAYKTQDDADIVEVETDGETTLRVTPDHEVRTRDRGWVEASELEPGDSLEILTKYDAPLGSVTGEDAEAEGTNYRWLNTGRRSNVAEHRLVASHAGEETEGNAVHHENYDSLDNRPENLTAMSKEEHDELHDISGEDNPINILKQRGEFEEFKDRNPFYDVEGEDNPMYGRSNRWAGVVEWECSLESCSTTLELAPAEARNREYCSQDCAHEARTLHVEFECQNCDETVVANGSGADERKYCTRACAAEDTLEGAAKEAFLRHLYVDNPMQRDEVKEKKVENTDYDAVGEAISETRQERIDSGELEVEVRDHGDVACRECGEGFGAVTNTHLRSAHDMTTEEYKEEYPDARLHGKRPVVTENHEVVAVTEVESADVYDLTVPDTHNFYAGMNVREDGTSRKDVYVNIHNCGEQPLMEYEACNLGHINLSTLAGEDRPDWRVFSADHDGDLEETVADFLDAALDNEELDRRIEVGTRFLDNVVTMSDFPVDRIERTVRDNRKVGLGIMGLAQLFIQLGVAYGSDEANEIARQIMRHINQGSKKVSRDLARKRGPFNNWEDSKWAAPTEHREWFEKHTGLDADEWADGYPIRNHNTTTIAPTGCVEEDSLVSTDEGLVPIGDLDETSEPFQQWDEIDVGVATDGGTKQATAVYDNGFADIRRIETEGGFTVASTPNHRFRTITGDGEYAWREADEFEPGDRIVLQRSTFDDGIPAQLDTSERENYYHNSDPDLTLPEEMSPKLAEFLGYFMGDGYVHEDVGVKLVVESDAEALEEHLRELGTSLFGVTPTVEDRDTRRILSFGGRHLPRYFEDNGWKKDAGNTGEGAASAFVPEEILRGDEAIAKAFLRGLFEADGTASRKVELSTVSPTLADQVQTLLLSLGCVFVRDTLEPADMDDHYGDRLRHCVRGANKREDKRFVDEIGFITKSGEFDLTPQSYKNDTYPPAVVGALREVDGYESVRTAVKHRVNQSPINGSVSRKLVRDVERETGETVRLDGRQLTDLYVATVESVTEDTAYTKDISVPSNNTYVADGFVTHNTTSMVGNTSGGCEPIFNVAYYKNVSEDVQGDEMLVEFDDYFLRVLEDNDIDVEAAKREAQELMSTNDFDGVDSMDTVPDAIGELFVTTGDLDAKQHAAVQCALQEGVDSAISKTVNAPNDATLADAKEAFEYAYEHGGKGVTYYRDGTRSKQVLTTRAENTAFADALPEDEAEAAEVLLEQIQEIFGELTTFVEHEVVRDLVDVEDLLDGSRTVADRPDTLSGVSQRVETGYGKLYVTINEDPETGDPFEVFANIGHSGGFTNSFTEAIGKITSSALRAGVPPEEIVDELCGTRSPKVAWDKGEQIQSIPDAIGTALRRYLDGDVDRAVPQQTTIDEVTEEESETDAATTTASTTEADDGPAGPETDGGVAAKADSQAVVDAGENPECPDCGAMRLYYSEGCKTCDSCGWSEC